MSLQAKIDCGQGAIRAVRFNKDGNYCITCGADKSVKLWNPYKQLKLKTYTGHSQEVIDADCSSDHSFICTGSVDKSVFYIDVKTAQIIRKYRAHIGRVNCVRFNLEESNLILSGSIDGKVRIWDLRSKSYEPLQEIDDFKDSVTHIDLNNHQILVSCLDKRVRLYDVRFGNMKCDYIGYPVTCSTLSKDDQCILVSLLDNRILLIDKFTGEMLNEYKGHINKDYQVESCMNNSSSVVISGSEDGNVYLWDVVDGKIKQKLRHLNKRTVHSISYNPLEDKILSAQEQFIYLWDLKE
ncbi:unnamed protein product [Brachionus calyciflorus]|uniref:WD repeat domain-containing protein 83 n=1 Tax=Brachionus calyciflorus TaxID=104777 RepID=A0A814DBR7_9BILA|nr:unnamed protein product [Brachionus calyciflorus]